MTLARNQSVRLSRLFAISRLAGGRTLDVGCMAITFLLPSWPTGWLVIPAVFARVTPARAISDMKLAQTC